MKRRAVIIGLGVTSIATLAGRWLRKGTVPPPNERIGPQHPVSVARLIASLQVWHLRNHGRFGTLADLTASAPFHELRDLSPLYLDFSSAAALGAANLSLSFELRNDGANYSILVGSRLDRHTFHVNERNVIYKGALESARRDGPGRFVGRPIQRTDLKPQTWSTYVAQFFEMIVPTVHAATHECCCCYSYNCDTKCPDVIATCAGACSACPDYCCVQGFTDCEACCATSVHKCHCAWDNPYCSGGGAGCVVPA